MSSAQRVALVFWHANDGMALAIRHELVKLGHRVSTVIVGDAIPTDVEVVLTFGPFGDLLRVPMQLAERPAGERPKLIHWSTEGMPDPRLPWPLMNGLAASRSVIGRLAYANSAAARRLAQLPLVRWLNTRAMRYRYVGDYFYGQQQGWLSGFAEISALYARRYQAHGLPAIVAPWGATSLWAADLNLPRDIDVLWMGKRASRRRGELLDRVRAELRRHNIEMYVADGVEHPFIYGRERTRLLHRTKITINLLRTWYDDNFVRFALTAPNRSLIVSEPLLGHCPDYVPGQHFVSAAANDLTETIRYYLAHESERQQIAEAARELVTTRLTLGNSLQTILNAPLLPAAKPAPLVTASPHDA